MLLSLRKNGLTSLFKKVRVFKEPARKILLNFRWKKTTNFQWRRAKHNHREASVLKIGAFCGGFFLPKSHWISLNFPLRTET